MVTVFSRLWSDYPSHCLIEGATLRRQLLKQYLVNYILAMISRRAKSHVLEKNQESKYGDRYGKPYWITNCDFAKC